MTSATSDPLVTVLIPTHDHASTLDLAVLSVLNQTVEALDIVIIGDGVGDDTRDVVSGLVSDRRVRFLDTPKSASRAEPVRHVVLTEACTPYVCYLGDDDLMLPDHVESTTARLEGVDFTHPLPLYIDREGSLRAHPADIADPASRAWHLHPTRNAISLTGVGHRLDAYRRLPCGWREAPAGSWSDHYMWQQWFGGPSAMFSTGDRLTVLKFDASVRSGMTADERRAELLAWSDRSTDPGFAGWLAAEAGVAFRRLATRSRLDLDASIDRSIEEKEASDARHKIVLAQTSALREEVETHLATIRALTDDVQTAEAKARQTREALEAVRATRTWRLHDRLARYKGVRQLVRMAQGATAPSPSLERRSASKARISGAIALARRASNRG